MAYIGKSPSTGIRNRFIYTATAGQATFSGTDDHNRTLSYTDAEFTDVFLNGVKLDKSDYTATSGTSIVLDEAAAAGDTLEVLNFDTFSVFSGEFSQDVTVGGATILSGDLTVDTDTLKVDSTNNRVGIGTTSPTDSQLDVRGTAGVKIGDGTCTLELLGRSDLGYAIIGTDTNHPIAMRTNNTERMRIDSSGNVLVGRTSTGWVAGGGILNDGAVESVVASGSSLFGRGVDTGSIILLKYNNSNVGSISTNGSSTSYNTTSDYRLKENVTGITDGIERVKQLNPSRFNFIADADTTVDGFLAHEAATVVPEAVTGEKDAVDEDGNPEYQGIDQAKLVPLLTAALQEAIAKIEALETENSDFEARIAALEAN